MQLRFILILFGKTSFIGAKHHEDLGVGIFQFWRTVWFLHDSWARAHREFGHSCNLKNFFWIEIKQN
jgi:hypothetical protein